jgi:phosphoribosyl-AMP cyclohydrolase
VVQERSSGDVLMVAWMDDATSRHTQHVHSVRVDCDGDAVLLQVDQVGGACHAGNDSCFDAEELLESEQD